MPGILIAADSRGAKLQRYFLKHHPLLHPHLIVKGGAQVSELHVKIKAALSSHYHYSPVDIVVAAGICNLTQKVYHEGGEQVTYDGETRQRVSDLLYQLHGLVTDININHHISVHVVCIPSVSLSKSAEQQILKNKLTFSILSESEMAQQQLMLEHDLKLVNLEIVQMNHMQGL